MAASTDGVQIVSHLAAEITRLFADSGATAVERYCALDVAKALVPVSAVSLCEPSDSPSSVHPESR